ncbi:MAG: nucleotidyltransferase domain-containing protein [Patescibacteria group bacterium]
MREFYQISQKEKEKIIQKISLFLEKEKEISFAYLFGSFLEEKPVTFRDIDIGVFLDPLLVTKDASFDYETNLAIQLSKLISFPADHLDIKVLNFTSKIFQNNIFSHGLLLFAKNSDLLTSFIEETSSEAIINYEFSKQSLLELLT